MKRREITLSCIFLFPLLLFSQSRDFWSSSTSEIPQSKRLKSFTEITEYQTLKLDLKGFENYVSESPLRSTKNSSIIVDIPDSKGNMLSFEMFKTNTMSPGLAKKFPSISSYVGQTEDKTHTLRLTTTERGVYGMILGEGSDVFINPMTSSGQIYQIFRKKNTYRSKGLMQCLVREDEAIQPSTHTENKNNMPDDGKLRTYELAVATTGEYSQFHINQAGTGGGTTAQQKASVLAAIVVTMDRVNGIYERDFAVTMTLIPNNEDIIYLNGSTDPFTNNSPSDLIDESQTTINSIIGPSNYDIGHTFSTQGGGLAQRPSVCTGTKARGVTGIPSPVGDPYDVDYVCHEMGHQFGANHTFNNSCGGNRNLGTAVEPGSGSTIMGYSGICPPNVQNASDAYFHTVSIDEVNTVITSGSGSTCGNATNISNTAPTITPLPSIYTIPYGTAFVLTGNATDTQGDAMTYCWEQVDNDPALMPPSPSNNVGPMFRSIEPTSSPSRFFPNINSVLQGNLTPTWEVIPNGPRTMIFTLTVRDNNIAGGQTSTETLALSVANTGPFEVTSQNTTNIEYDQSEDFQVTWDVAGTTGNGINTANVDIMLSYLAGSGGDFPVMLAQNVPNDGSHTVTAPIGTTSSICKIMVKASDNIFYAVNDQFFTITNTVATTEFSQNAFSIYPNPNNGEFTLISDGMASGKTSLMVYDIQGRIIGKYEFNANGKMEKTIQLNNPQTGIYLLQIVNGNRKTTKKLIVE